jgi:glycosyltransferase involved in cell wall biosynthesis
MPQTRRRLDKLTLKRRYVDAADHIICISDATRRDLLSVYPAVAAPLSVVHLAVDEQFRPGLPPLPDLPDNYVILVGHRGQYKDAVTLFRAFAQVSRDFPDVHLVCIGGGVFTKDERTLLQRLGIAHRVRQDVLSDPRMPAAYGNALAFVFPSRFEGFGLPVLEAMASGAPTILAESTSLPEVGADAALYFPVGDDSALAKTLTEVLSEPKIREELSLKGVARAAEFSWERTAQATEQVYRTALLA